MRTVHERGLTSNAARKGVVEAEPMPNKEQQPRAVAATPLVPELTKLSEAAIQGRAQAPSFAVSANTLGELLTRINMSGAKVAARLKDATRRVHIASLRPVPDADGRSMVARLQVSNGRPGGTDTVEVQFAPGGTGEHGAAAEPSAQEPESVGTQPSPGAMIDVVG